MAGQYDNRNRGALFRNKKKVDGDNRPDYTGKLDIDGTEYFISGWVKKSQGGMSYLSLARQTQQPQSGPVGQAPPAARRAPEPPVPPPIQDDDIPF